MTKLGPFTLNHYFTKLGFTNVSSQGHSSIGSNKTITLPICHHYSLPCPLDSGMYSLHTSHYTTCQDQSPWPCLHHSNYKVNPLCVFIIMLLQTCHRYNLLHSVLYLFHSICHLPSKISLTMLGPLTLHDHSTITFHPNITFNLTSLLHHGMY
jgi:hypothetical protein